MPSKREKLRAERLRRARMNRLAAIAGGLVLLGVIGYLILRNSQPVEGSQLGESVTVLADTSHVPDGTDPGPYNSDPPTSGRHYANAAEGGFYDTHPFPSHPDGYLVHSLEHGYVIFWYNCDLPSVPDCDALKDQIKGVMEDEANFKVIAFPWPSINVPVVMTSWGKIFRMETFDEEQAAAFVQANRNRAPEPEQP